MGLGGQPPAYLRKQWEEIRRQRHPHEVNRLYRGSGQVNPQKNFIHATYHHQAFNIQGSFKRTYPNNPFRHPPPVWNLGNRQQNQHPNSTLHEETMMAGQLPCEWQMPSNSVGNSFPVPFGMQNPCTNINGMVESQLPQPHHNWMNTSVNVGHHSSIPEGCQVNVDHYQTRAYHPGYRSPAQTFQCFKVTEGASPMCCDYSGPQNQTQQFQFNSSQYGGRHQTVGVRRRQSFNTSYCNVPEDGQQSSFYQSNPKRSSSVPNFCDGYNDAMIYAEV